MRKLKEEKEQILAVLLSTTKGLTTKEIRAANPKLNGTMSSSVYQLWEVDYVTRRATAGKGGYAYKIAPLGIEYTVEHIEPPHAIPHDFDSVVGRTPSAEHRFDVAAWIANLEDENNQMRAALQEIDASIQGLLALSLAARRT